MQSANAIQENIGRYEQYAKSDPQNVSLLLQLGDLYHQAGRFDDAFACFERCLALEPGNARASGRKGLVMISQHRFADAEAILAKAANEGDRDPALLHNLGLAVYYQHRWGDARKYFADAATKGLMAPSNFAYLARALHHMSEMPDAIKACESWMELARDDASKSYLALLHTDGGNMDTARRLGLEVLAQDAANVDANVAVGSASIERQESDLARSCFGLALSRDPENGRAWLGMGLVHLYDQETPQAIHALESAARIFPDNAGIAVTLGWAHLIDKNAAAAEQAFENALRVDRTFAESHAGLAAALALQNKLDRAQEEIKLAKRLDPGSIGADVAKTFLLSAQGQQRQATDVFTNVLKQSPRKGVAPLIEQLRIYTRKKGPIQSLRANSSK
jgi:tetratricopeptide (TPR) repeat protein